ncbi:hypothetical protein Atai01_26870 [Amycolatopsis taiwanensis]|uniref:Uncharacterized protein n=1 Tax=Amycolatopsis taiwanensis TaxID=342230 RepID=A0A9W6VCE4_9PSEU|nr:hypothetical protein Atai01_26870 [Amycolatopsis taiwanensis]
MERTEKSGGAGRVVVVGLDRSSLTTVQVDVDVPADVEEDEDENNSFNGLNPVRL